MMEEGWERWEVALELTANEHKFLDFYFPEVKGEEREELIKKFQKKALNCYKYPCIKRFGFVKPSIGYHSRYHELIANNIDTVKVLDIGCCLGTDLRFLIANGAKVENLQGFELLETFIELGFEFFNDRSEKTNNLFTIVDILHNVEHDQRLTQFLGYFDVIYTASVLHLFSFPEQIILCQNIKKLLKNGGHFIGKTTGLQNASVSHNMRGEEIFLHDEKSLRKHLNEWFGNDLSEATMIVSDLSNHLPRLPFSNVQPRTLLTFSATKL